MSEYRWFWTAIVKQTDLRIHDILKDVSFIDGFFEKILNLKFIFNFKKIFFSFELYSSRRAKPFSF